MLRRLRDSKNKFIELFDGKTGFYARTGILEEKDIDTGIDAFMRFMPALIDIGIMGSCVHGKTGLCAKSGIQCYQDGLNVQRPNMSVTDYNKIMQECTNKVWQVALGGRGDPDMHENFEEILKISREYGIVPNFTTSGLGMSAEKAKICKKYCGAVAVSAYSRLNKYLIETSKSNGEIKECYYSQKEIAKGETEITLDNKEFRVIRDYKHTKIRESCNYSWLFEESAEYTINAINSLLEAGVKTNIHFVIGNNTIDEAITRLKYNLFPTGINAVIFLLHKPVGLGKESNMLEFSNDKVKEFYSLCDGDKKYPFKLGFDSCNVPALLNMTKNIEPSSMDTCEAARFSMYVSSDMVAMPCSFDNETERWGVKLDYNNGLNIEYSWKSEKFEHFRDIFRGSCRNCKDRLDCLGGCPIKREVVLCNRRERK